MFAADRRLQDKDCYENNCALCHFPTRMNLSIRGLCSSDTKVSEGYFDRFYFIQGYISDNPHWRGFGKSHIYYRPRRQVWRLESFYDLERYAEFFADDSNPYSKFENNIVKLREREGSTQEGHSKVIYRWWMVDILSLMLYTKFGCHHHHLPTVLLLISRIKLIIDQVR